MKSIVPEVGIMDASVMMVTAHSNRDLTSQEFERQAAMIKPVMSWDQPTWTWRARLAGAPPSTSARRDHPPSPRPAGGRR
ncbi:hypothetical protein [Nonomuraea sp. NPDC005650]|uniref:hypothetical protein n=1 Tax=Nonomuraea sp. NPDC005650 TaxID=3157045 RepID=UPI0033A38FC2